MQQNPIYKTFKNLGAQLAFVGGIAGISGKAAGISDQATAISVLVVVSAILVYRWKKFDGLVKARTVVTSVLILISFGLIGSRLLSKFWLDRTISAATGIIDYSPKANDYLPKLPALIEGAKAEIWITGISFYITLPANRDLLLKKLGEGVNVKFLIYNPMSSNNEETAGGFGQSIEVLNNECYLTIAALRDLQEVSRKAQTKGRLEVRLFSTVPKMRLYMFDRESENGKTFFIPHVDHQNSPNVPGFLAKNIRTGIVPPFIEGAERIWNKATTFDDFLPKFDAGKSN